MDPAILIGAIVRQTTLLLAQIATGTAPGERATLADTANQVFTNLVRELREQGVSSKGIADMFGLTLRTFHHRMNRATESHTRRGISLWDAIHEFLEERGMASRAEILDRFRADDERLVRGVLRELVSGSVVFRTGRGPEALFRIARLDDMPRGGDTNAPLERLASLLWVAVKRNGPIGLRALAKIVPASDVEIARAIDHLVTDGRIARRDGGADTEYFADEFVIPIGSSAGWEAAVFDHYQALVTTITTKLRVAGRNSAADDWIGGSTYSIELDRDHLLFEEVVGFLRATRERAVDLRRRVAEVNRTNRCTARAPVKVILYVGQTVLGLELDGEVNR